MVDQKVYPLEPLMEVWLLLEYSMDLREFHLPEHIPHIFQL